MLIESLTNEAQEEAASAAEEAAEQAFDDTYESTHEKTYDRRFPEILAQELTKAGAGISTREIDVLDDTFLTEPITISSPVVSLAKNHPSPIRAKKPPIGPR